MCLTCKILKVKRSKEKEGGGGLLFLGAELNTILKNMLNALLSNCKSLRLLGEKL